MAPVCNENSSIGLYDVYFLVQLIYGVPSLYVWARIIKSVVVFVNDMIFTCFLLTGRFCAAISSAFSNDYSYWLSPTVFIAMYGIGCQCTGTVLLVLNRLTAVLTLRHTEIWSRYLLAAYVFLFVPSLSISWNVRIDNNGSSLTIAYAKILPWISTTLYTTVIGAVAGVAIILLNGATMLCFRRMRRMKLETSRVERTVFITGLFQSMSTLILCIYQLAMLLLIHEGLNLKLSFLFTLRSFFWDILTLLPAWTTFLTNEPIRRTFTGRRKWTTQNSSIGRRSSGWAKPAPES